MTARVTGTAYGAFFTPAGTPFEDSVPFALDLTNAATGIAGLPIEYVPPVVTVGGSPSGSLPDGTSATADATGHAAIFWPRGLPCDLFVRPIIEREGFMRSGGVVIGGGQDAARRVSLRGGHQRRRRRNRERRVSGGGAAPHPVEHAAARDQVVPGPARARPRDDL